MKLSDAIRLGSMIRPQAFGEYYAHGGSCAAGAAFEAVGIPEINDSAWSAQEETWNRTLGRHVGCPVNQCCFGRSVVNMVVHLNDDHQWTREQIADWVEGLECSAATTATTCESTPAASSSDPTDAAKSADAVPTVLTAI